MKILTLNNWNGLMNFFHQYVDHDTHEIHYICDNSGIKGIETFLDPQHIPWLMMNFHHRPRNFTGFHCVSLSSTNCMHAMWSTKLGRRIETAYDYITFAFRVPTFKEVHTSINELVAKVYLVTEVAQ